jgi:hypothetical protein
MQFTSFLTLLAEIKAPRRAEGKLYRLPHVVLLPIGLAVFLVAIGLPSGDLTLDESLIRHPAIEALG